MPIKKQKETDTITSPSIPDSSTSILESSTSSQASPSNTVKAKKKISIKPKKKKSDTKVKTKVKVVPEVKVKTKKASNKLAFTPKDTANDDGKKLKPKRRSKTTKVFLHKEGFDHVPTFYDGNEDEEVVDKTLPNPDKDEGGRFFAKGNKASQTSARQRTKSSQGMGKYIMAQTNDMQDIVNMAIAMLNSVEVCYADKINLLKFLSDRGVGKAVQMVQSEAVIDINILLPNQGQIDYEVPLVIEEAETVVE